LLCVVVFLFIQEVIHLRRAGLKKDSQAGRAIGYRSTLEFLERLESLPSRTPQALDDLFLDFLSGYQAVMRQYAKRQWQWFKKEIPLFRWVNAASPTLVEDVLHVLTVSDEEKAREDDEIRLRSLDPETVRRERLEESELHSLLRRYQPSRTIFQTQEARANLLHNVLGELAKQ